MGGGLWTRLRRLRRRHDREVTTGEGVDRRTLLMGAAATTAGVVATGAVHGVAAPGASAVAGAALPAALPAASVAPAQALPDTIPASQVTVVPTGEITKTNAQEALAELDGRLSKVRIFEDLQVAMTLVDDFMGNTATSGTIGQLGWALPSGATGTAAAALGANQPGIFVIGTGTTSSGWNGINLGTNNLFGAPLFMCEWRLQVTNLNSSSNQFSCWFGLHNATTALEPTSGFYFRYTPGDTHWFAACANGGAPNAVVTGAVVDTGFHRFRITSGAGVARFYIDDVQVAMLSSSLPSSNRYTPNVMLRKSLGTAARTLRLDYFALRYEQAR